MKRLLPFHDLNAEIINLSDWKEKKNYKGIQRKLARGNYCISSNILLWKRENLFLNVLWAMDFLLMSAEGRQLCSWLFEEVQSITVWSDTFSFSAFFCSQLHGRHSEIIAPFQESQKSGVCCSHLILGITWGSQTTAGNKSVCTTNACSLPWSGSGISALPPTKLDFPQNPRQCSTHSPRAGFSTKEISTIAPSLNKTHPRLQ